MPLKFRLKGLAETFVEQICCSHCGHSGGEGGDEGFSTELTRVTYDGIIVVIECDLCGNIFLPDGQKMGIVNTQRLRSAVEKDSVNTGQPIFERIDDVRLEVERLNAERQDCVH
jgi:hypothetical protein